MPVKNDEKRINVKCEKTVKKRALYTSYENIYFFFLNLFIFIFIFKPGRTVELSA